MRTKTAAVFVFVCVCASGGVDAHEIATPKVDTVTVSAADVSVNVEYAIDARRSADLRRVYDRDANETLDDAERPPFEAWLRLVATRHLVVTLDGRKLKLGERSASFGGIDGAVPVDSGREVHAVFVLGTALGGPLAAGAHAIVVTDRDRDARVQVPVTIEFVAPLVTVKGAARTGMLDATASSLAVPFLAP